MLFWGFYVFHWKKNTLTLILNLGKFSHGEKQCSGSTEWNLMKSPFMSSLCDFLRKMVHVVIDMYFSSLGLKIFLNPRLSLIIPLTRCGNQLRYELYVTPLSGFDAFDQFSCFYTKNAQLDFLKPCKITRNHSSELQSNSFRALTLPPSYIHALKSKGWNLSFHFIKWESSNHLWFKQGSSPLSNRLDRNFNLFHLREMHVFLSLRLTYLPT